MGLSQGRSRTPQRARGGTDAGVECKLNRSLHSGLLPSVYRSRVARLAQEALEQPPPEQLELTLRRCIAFCYTVTPEWAPHVRVTAFADNPSEHQSNVPVYETLLVAWGVPGFEGLEVKCTPVAGTDVMYGIVVPNPFWSRSLSTQNGQQVPCRALMHQLLYWFVSLDDVDPRKQLLVNILLQLHEACYNCIGRHKEVFEYCIYDLVDAEAQTQAGTVPSASVGAEVGVKAGIGFETLERAQESEAATASEDAAVLEAKRIVHRFAANFLDRHKRAAVHAMAISPLKFLFQNRYEVFENLDSHGSSFWVAVLSEVFFPDLQMPFEEIIDLDKGWTWGAVDFLPTLTSRDASASEKEALRRLSAPENLGRDWRQLTAGLKPSGRLPRRLPGVSFFGERAFRNVLREARRPNSSLRAVLQPYAARFADLMVRPIILRRCVHQASVSERWGVDLGPALATLSGQAIGTSLSAAALQERLMFSGGSGQDGCQVDEDLEAMAALLRVAGVTWA
mmetsp:Transcript_69062/g.174066  ORF Transcript_69062/g.174066 Transcript_69062/m.174066 type:complete len:508 (-) Transcript_69062:269-1792(-)|eukprot:CAMPEP_0115395992 /NCGR_PEP_ID=MMETSP0271-20121206/13066_1 /TAXON_ID=71861 /ORGANISM="Scrippsiella trochoidea, Strain CCMP3099" /LENGTH=507 /DNA_ID=CAMNT_0002819709 /DNA_START=8 /DNA_END=1531 /DNA_ORIENTATION=+